MASVNSHEHVDFRTVITPLFESPILAFRRDRTADEQRKADQ